MRLLMIGLILLALLAAGGSAVLVKRYLDNQAAQQAKLAVTKDERPAAFVLVADEDLAAGTTLSSGSFRWQKWPDDAIESSFLSSEKKDPALEKKLIGTVVRRGVAAGTPITEAMVFRRQNAGFMAGALEEGMRGVAIAVDATTGAAGFILPGDRVDVILTFDVRELSRSFGKPKPAGSEGGSEGEATDLGPAKYSSETILQGLRVLAIDQNFKDVEGEAAVAKTVTLQVTPKQAEILSVARAMGKLGLSLQSLSAASSDGKAEAYTSDVDVSPTLRAIIAKLSEENKKKGEAESRRARRPASLPEPPRQRAVAPDGAKVRVFRGAQETTQEFPAR